MRSIRSCATVLVVLVTNHFAVNLYGQIIQGPLEVKLEPFAVMPGRAGAALTLTHADDGSGRIFAAGRNGRVELIKDGVLQETPFLDMRDLRTEFRVSTSGEGGLLGMAFHPSFDATPGTPGAGKLYTHTTESRGRNGPNPDFNHPELEAGNRGVFHSVIREWSVSADNPDLVDTSIASRVLMRINQPQDNHDGGAIDFGPDNNLYIALGDGGGGNDGDRRSPTDGHTNGPRGVPHGNGQDVTNIYGSIVRIDPLGSNSANGQYGIPADNPFVNAEGVDEIFAYGLRNPYRMSFDRQTGDLYAADVGQSSVEEIDVITLGGNYGWAIKEGTRTVRRDVEATDLIDPIAEYTHRDGISVIGGFVYRGTRIPELAGHYVFGDLLWPRQNAGRLFYLDPSDPEIHEFMLDSSGEQLSAQIWSFGEDEAGELYVLMGNREIMRIARSTPALEAGDANQDLEFNQLDIVQVTQAAMYLTGQQATWGEGDWDGAPGGRPGSPPAGNGLFDQLDIVAAQQNGLYLAGPYAAIAAGGRRGDPQTSIVYDAGSGEIAVDAPAGTELTSVNIDSAAGIFTGQPAQNLGGSFDNDADANIFKATFGSSFGSLSFGAVAQPGLAEQFVLDDLTVVGSLAGGGALGDVDLIYVPEPTTFLLLSLGLLSTAAWHWRKARRAES